MDGLSADKLRVLLHPIKEKKEVEPSKENSDKEEMKFDLQKAKEVMEQDFRDNMVLATLQDGTRGKWKTAQVMYSFALPHKVMYYIIFFLKFPVLMFFSDSFDRLFFLHFFTSTSPNKPSSVRGSMPD